VPHQRLLGDRLQVGALDRRRGAVKYCSTKSLCKPTASKICAPQ